MFRLRSADDIGLCSNFASGKNPDLPLPFQCLITAGCFIENGAFHVGDFRSCGVALTVDLGWGPEALSMSEFAASLLPRQDSSASFTVETRFTDNGQEATILGILGGAAVEIIIGAEMGTALPSAVETVGANPPDDQSRRTTG